MLHDFTGTEGAKPLYGVILDESGNIFGNTSTGGTSDKGTFFKIAPGGTTTVLFSYGGPRIGPAQGIVIKDKDGNFYGNALGGVGGQGVTYKLTPTGQPSVLHAFGATSTDGTVPTGRLVNDGKGNLYGTTHRGGLNNYGTVFG